MLCRFCVICLIYAVRTDHWPEAFLKQDEAGGIRIFDYSQTMLCIIVVNILPLPYQFIIYLIR